MVDDLDQDYGGYFWRGGAKIELEKEENRFTVIPDNRIAWERADNLPGVRRIKPVSRGVFKVETTDAERDIIMDVLRNKPFNAIVHHAYRPKGETGTVYYLTDKITVKFQPECPLEQQEALLEKYRLQVLKEYTHLPGTFLLRITASSGENPLKIANRIREEEGVLEAEPNLVNRFHTAYRPADPYFKNQWHLEAEKGLQLLAEASVNAPAAWDISRGKREITVALIDDGFDLEHPDLCGEGKIVAPHDFVDDDTRPFPEAGRNDYHGTPCAGVALAEMNGEGVVGVAPGCSFMPVRFPLEADDDRLIEIFVATAQKAHVISCSWGPPPVYAPLSLALQETLTELALHGGPNGKGVVICFAAANFNAPINSPGISGGLVWLDYGTGKQMKTVGRIQNGFAAHPRVVTVAASTSLNRHAAYSNWGPEVSVAAPSNNFHPLDPDQYMPGRGIWTIDNEKYGYGFTKNSIYTENFGGTSSATPLVAGIAGLILSVHPGLTAAEVKQIMEDTADKIEDLQDDPILKTNRGRYDAAGRCDWFGFGKVNAAKALRQAELRREQPDSRRQTELLEPVAALP
jgi:subtilisin family serine protease